MSAAPSNHHYANSKPKMRLPTFAALAALAATAAADSMTVYTWCNIFTCSSTNAVWHASWGDFGLNANGGCRDPPDPNMYELCMDWNNNRAHFYFYGQGKRCLRKTVDVSHNWGSGCGIDVSCYRSEWTEVGCSW